MKKLMAVMAVCLLLSISMAAHAADRPKRILVYGDSNTFGYFEDAEGMIGRLPTNVAWPGKMAKELGDGYEVIVEGLSGRTTNMDSAVRSGTGLVPGAGMNGASYLPAALSSHMPLDLVIVMLGTNDLRADRNRSAFDIALATGELVSIISRAEWQSRTRFAAPRVLVVCPPKLDIKKGAYKDFFAGSLAKSEALPGALKPVAEAAGAAFFDAATVVPFAQGPDEIHLTPENHAALGVAVAQEVKHLFAE